MNKILLSLVLAFAMPLSALAETPAPALAKTPSPAVRDVAAHPAQHLGPLILRGVAGIVSPGKGFVLVDMQEYREEGFACLATDEPTKISVKWKGAAPKVKEALQVRGDLVREKRGYAFIARTVTKQ